MTVMMVVMTMKMMIVVVVMVMMMRLHDERAARRHALHLRACGTTIAAAAVPLPANFA